MMMRPGKSASAFALLSVVVLGAGCRQSSSHLRVAHSTDSAASHSTASHVILAGSNPEPEPQAGEPQPVQPPAENPPVAAKSATPVARNEPPVSTTPGTTYTAPGAAYQQLAIATAAAAVGVVPTAGGTGKEAAESLVFSPQGTSGRLGLVTTATSSSGSIVSSSGLGDGVPSRIGSAAQNNIFTAQVNRASGPTGRCRELTNAGHFGGSRPQCAVSFRGRR